MDGSKKIKVGLIGAGANTKLRHIPGFKEIDGVAIDVVCNRSRASSQAVADEFGIPRIAEKWEDVVADSEIDAICIGTWPYLHAPVTLASLEAGKHVLTEARMAMNAEEATAMWEASRKRSDLVAQIVPSPFSLPWDKTIAEFINKGRLGDLRELHFSKALSMNADPTTPMNWRQDRSLSGNNTLMLGIYYEPILRWLPEEPKRVLAKGAVYTKMRRHEEFKNDVPVEIPETVSLIAEYESGLILSGRMTGVELGNGRDEYVINGSRGTLRLDLNDSRLSFAPLGGEEREIEVASDGAGEWRVEADFIDSIREGKPVERTNFTDGLRYMRFTDAVVSSAERDGAWQQI